MTVPVPEHVPAEWDEDLYQATVSVLVEPEVAGSPWQGLGCLLLTIVLFAASFLWSTDLRFLGFIIAILLLHEAGHFVGMRAFGYRNVRMFFIPFFGAAVSGSKHAAPVWQQGVVLLLGPLPGILLALLVQAVYRPSADAWLGDLVVLLVIVNAFNLLPVVPLDGGRLVDVLFFARRPWLAVGFRVVAVFALLVGAWALGAWPLGIVGVLILLTTPMRYRKARLERVFRDNPMELPERVEELSDSQRRELFGWAMLLNPLDRTPTSLASDMRSLHENMVSRRPGLLVGLVLVALYLGGIAWGVGTLVLSARDTKEARVVALVSAGRETIEQVAELRRQRERLGKAEPAKSQRLLEESRRIRQELVKRWRAAPADVQSDAQTRLFSEPSQGDDVARMRLFFDLFTRTPDEPKK